MSYPEREQTEEQEEASTELRIVAKQDGAPNGVGSGRSAAEARLQRTELAALGWDARRRRLSLR